MQTSTRIHDTEQKEEHAMNSNPNPARTKLP